MIAGEWIWSTEHKEPGRFLEANTAWGGTSCRIWLPGRNVVAIVRLDSLRPLSSALMDSPDGVRYAAAAARISDASAHDVLLGPIESSIIPLPHQIRVLSRAMSGDRVRYLLADEVGLGKTI